MNEMMINITFDLIYLLSSSLVVLILFAFFRKWLC